MSKNEDFLEKAFNRYGVKFEKQVPINIENYPWKTTRSKTNPKCDFYLPEYNLYIEVKGFMTIEAISKMAFLAKHVNGYYIYQCTEYEWNPYIDNINPISTENIENGISKTKQLQININVQINELCTNQNKYFANISNTSNKRLIDFIQKKVNQYEKWNGKWY